MVPLAPNSRVSGSSMAPTCTAWVVVGSLMTRQGSGAWRQVSGQGTLYTFTVARVPTLPEFSDEMPQLLAVVELDEGVHINTTLVGVDPAMQMHHLAQKRSQKAGIEVELMGLSAEQLPTADASFDTVVCTYTLCSIPDAVQALREMRRVLVPGGKLLFCEHGRAPDESVRRWQDRLQPLWGPLAGGCHLGRDIPALLEDAGFAATTQAAYLPGTRLMTFHYWGEAQAA